MVLVYHPEDLVKRQDHRELGPQTAQSPRLVAKSEMRHGTLRSSFVIFKNMFFDTHSGFVSQFSVSLGIHVFFGKI